MFVFYFIFFSGYLLFPSITYFDLLGLCEVCSFKLNYHHKRKEVTKKTSRNVKREKKSKSKKRKKKHHREKKKERGGKTKRQESSSSSSESSDKEEQTGEHRKCQPDLWRPDSQMNHERIKKRHCRLSRDLRFVDLILINRNHTSYLFVFFKLQLNE